MLVFDGCAGTGSATQAFKDRGHIVETLDIRGDHTYVMDIRDFHPSKCYDFMWFSPPCTEFSLVNWRARKCRDRKPDMSIIEACFRIVKEIKPAYWIIENPRGCLRYFIGKPTITVKYSDYGYIIKKPTDLWGEFPWFWSHVKPNENTIALTDAKQFLKRETGIDRVLNRAKIPYNLSLAICKAIEKEL